MVTNVDLSFLTSYYQSRSGATGGALAPAGATKRATPTAPWNGSVTPAESSAAVKAALLGRKFINEGAAKLDVIGASADYRKLFALYQGLSTLMSVVEQSQSKGLLPLDRTRLGQTFARGLDEISSYVDQVDLEKIRLIQGQVSTVAKATLGVPKNKTEYQTPPLVSGSATNVVEAFTGNVQFNVSVKRSGATLNVPIDLAGMGAQPRSMVNVVDHINSQLQAAGVDARVASQRIPGAPKTTTVNGKTVTLGTTPDQFALKVKVSTGETVSFSAPATAGAVYLAQDAGNPDPDGKAATADGTTASQFLKFQTDTTSVPGPLQAQGEANWVDGRVFAKTLGPEVKTVRDTKVAADGSVYMLADVTKKVAGQDIKGEQDVALLKYDAAGKLLFARTLGAAEEASGLSLALSTDGKIAVAGSVVGQLSGAVNGALNSTGSDAGLTDSFVTVYDGEGDELWTQRRGARKADEASEVAFGADGTVYVSGRTSSGLPGATALGGSDSYLEAFKADATGKIQTLFTTTYGTATTDRPAGLVVDGTSVVTASVENGRAVLRRFDVSGPAPVLTSTRDLGDLQGGDITGLELDGTDVVVAGTTRNAALAAGTVTKAHAGGSDAFAAKISADLGPGGTIAYYGGAGDDKATALSVSGGQVWIAGSAGTDLPGNPTAVGVKDAFLARLDVDAGTVAWSRRFTGKDSRAAPTSIAVDTTGASVLDRIGLPKGELDLTDSPRLTSASSLRAGDQFSLKIGSLSKAVTIEDKDTLDTLAQKIRRATGFQAKVTLVTVDGLRSLRVEPVTDRIVLEFTAGKSDKDALAMLGIPDGIVRKTKFVDGRTVSADGRGQIYGLGLDPKMRLDEDLDRKHAAAEIGAAMGFIRQAYKDLVAGAIPKDAQAAAAKPSGPVPAYLTNQIANYQAALQRLGG
ncbi:hypothetical protein [uncultured Phenylobacterium sp.]|uniref:hypothetical protein n=1 Tax=uncultured Phenylobacterium sp. TaxID=349273 RepID=UPI0025D16A50|nr:hypothetical protein [uncultured Phenylobacterium sp.]